MNILMTGGTGFLGTALISLLLSEQHVITVLTRDTARANCKFSEKVTLLTDLNKIKAQDRFDVVINLAGAPVLDKHWSEARKQVIRDSRIKLTQQLLRVIAKQQHKPELLISGSAIGFYGNQGDTELDENSPAVSDFSHQLCKDWEQAALSAEKMGIRVCLIRTGIVLGESDGIIKKMLIPYKLGLGGQQGDGKQWISWIHINDWVSIVMHMIKDPLMQGVYNATATNPVSNQTFSKTLANCLNRPARLNIPSYFLKMLLGERAQLLLGSQKVLPRRLLEQGFQFQFNRLPEAIEHIVHSEC